MTFTVPVTCQGYQVANTVWTASVPHMDGVSCSWTRWWPEAATPGEGIETALDAVFEGAFALFGGETETR